MQTAVVLSALVAVAVMIGGLWHYDHINTAVIDRCIALQKYAECMDKRGWVDAYDNWCHAEAAMRAVRVRKDVAPLCEGTR